MAVRHKFLVRPIQPYRLGRTILRGSRALTAVTRLRLVQPAACNWRAPLDASVQQGCGAVLHRLPAVEVSSWREVHARPAETVAMPYAPDTRERSDSTELVLYDPGAACRAAAATTMDMLMLRLPQIVVRSEGAIRRPGARRKAKDLPEPSRGADAAWWTSGAAPGPVAAASRSPSRSRRGRRPWREEVPT